jgi:hypothetical protein
LPLHSHPTAIFVLVAFASTAVFAVSDLTKPAPRRHVTLQGEEAHQWLEKFWHQDIGHLSAHMKAVALLQARGYKPLNQWWVEIQGTPREEESAIVKLIEWFYPKLSAGYMQTGDGAVWASSWADGDVHTWEGEQGGEDYGVGNYADGAQQWQLNNPGQVNWASGYVEYDSVGYSRYATQWARCYLGGCGTSIGACAIANVIDGEAAFLPCAVAWCGGSFVFCGASYLYYTGMDYLCWR